MRKSLLIVCIIAIVAFLIGAFIPGVKAQDDNNLGEIIFHVLPNGTGFESRNLSEIPPDQQDIIIVAGTNTDKSMTRIAIQNLCAGAVPTGTPTPTVTASPTPTGTVTPGLDCSQVDLYFELTYTLDWNSWLEDNCGPWGVCERDVSGRIDVHYGSDVVDYTVDSWGHCGSAGHATGSCTNTLSGTIAADDIVSKVVGDDLLNEFFEITLHDFWGGTSFSASYSLMLSTSPIQKDCAGQYNIGGVLGSFTITATNSTGVNLQTTLGLNYPAPGQWYAVQVSGGWYNNGTGPELRSIGHKVGIAGNWFPLVASPDVGCADTGNNTYYLQMINADAVYMRVYDTDGNFASNTGSVTVSISSITAYTQYPDGCELEYQIGDLIEQKDVPATLEDGRPLKKTEKYGTGGSGTDRQPVRFYMLETIGGPANIGGGDLSFRADIGIRNTAADLVPDSWNEIQTAAFVTCFRPTDLVGHMRVFFPADNQATLKGPLTDYYYAFRVLDPGSYSDNSGSIGYRLYEATNMQMTVPGDVPGPNGCNLYTHDAAPITTVTVQADVDSGASLPALVSRSLYALEVDGGPWQEGGVSDSYSIELSDDAGGSWEDLEYYPQLLCAASADGDHIIIYLYGAAGKHWKVRVNDQDTNFVNNTGSIDVNLYAGHTSINEYPNCSQEYTTTLIPLSDDQRTIPGNMAGGKDIMISSLDTSADTFMIEITDEHKWFENGTGDGSYLVDLSDDGGDTWVNIEDYDVLCREQIGDGDRFRIVVNKMVGGNSGPDPIDPNVYQRKMRVRDGDNNFLSNSGYVMFKLYKANATNPDDGDGNTINPPPPEWVVACNETYLRPGGFVKLVNIGTILGVGINVPMPMVGEWLDYVRNSVVYYFAWCPQHTAALQAVGTYALDKDPFKSINDMVTFFKGIQTLIDSYQAAGGADVNTNPNQEPDMFADAGNMDQATGGGSVPQVPAHNAGAWDMFVVGTLDPATNVWFGGKVDLTTALNSGDTSGMAAYESLCYDKFYPVMGITTNTYCKFMVILRYRNIIKWLLLILDLFVAVIWFLKYLPNYLKRFIRILSGRKAV
jgi:hypothetical protein